MRLRDDHAFEQRRATIETILDDLGPIRSYDGGKLEEVRRFEVALDTPEPPLPARARFRYLEWWSRDGRGWSIAKYQYDYLDLMRRGRLAYHRHALAHGPDSLHIHCETSGSRRSAVHFRAYEVDVLEAHEEFAALYSNDRPITCAGLRPLRAREGADA